MKRVAIYARFSSDMQRVESISAQVRACKVFCTQKKNEYEIVKIYKDEAKSGRNDQREEFQKMIADSARGLFDMVLVHKLGRFSRDAADTMYYKKILKKNHVTLISVVESYDDTPEGNFMQLVSIGINELFVMNLARETKKGQLENAYKCLSTGGNGPLGYDVVDKHFVINEHDAEAVRLIFTMYDAGAGYRQIINRLNVLGYRTKRGQPFAKNSLYAILRNPKYCGRYVYNRSYGPDEFGKRNSHRYKELDKQVVIEDGVPAIIEKDLWERIQQKMDDNRHRGGSFRAKRQYLLTGKIHCGLCGGSYHGNCRKPAKNRPEFYSYRCCNRDVKHSTYCKNREIEKEQIESFVLEQIEHYFFNEDIIPTLTKELNEYLKQNSQTARAEEPALLNKVEELEKQRSNIVDAIAQTGMNGVLGDKLREIEAILSVTKVNLIEAQQTVLQSSVMEDMVREYFLHIRKVANSDNVSQLKEMVKSYVDRIEIFPDTVKITFKVAMKLRQNTNTPLEYSFAKSIDRESLAAS